MKKKYLQKKTLFCLIVSLCSYCILIRVGYRNPVPTWHLYLWNRYVPNRIRMQISVPHFSAMPERSVEIFVLCFSETDVRSIITGTTCAKYFPDWENAHELNSESSNNRSPTNLCSNASAVFIFRLKSGNESIRGARECSNYTCSDDLPLTSYATTSPWATNTSISNGL